MADKQIVELPHLPAVTDETQIPVYQPGAAEPAQRMSGKQFKEFGETAVEPHVQRAVHAAAAAQGAYEGVRAALDNIPEGDTPIINDLTTGGTKAALSAEQGKVLNDNKVNKAGDTMTDTLITENTEKGELGLMVRPADGGRHSFVGGYNGLSLASVNVVGDYTNSRTLFMSNSKAKSNVNEAVRLRDMVNGKFTDYTILHTGNKPSGSYTGNGDATKRTIETGGIGECVAIRYLSGFAIVGYSGAIYAEGTTLTTDTKAISRNGVLTLAGESGKLNVNGTVYTYQVL